jgi:hypothetical protein
VCEREREREKNGIFLNDGNESSDKNKEKQYLRNAKKEDEESKQPTNKKIFFNRVFLTFLKTFIVL